MYNLPVEWHKTMDIIKARQRSKQDEGQRPSGGGVRCNHGDTT